MDRPAITAIVHTRNRVDTLDKALHSLCWVDELIVADMKSDDGTLDVARRHDARIISLEPAPRVDGVRNQVADMAIHPWILVLDSDEWLPEDAEEAVADLLRSHGDRFDAFSLPRYNYVGDQLLTGPPWYPDNQIRIFRKGSLDWSDSNHVPPRLNTGWHRLKELRPPGCLHIHHRNYRDLRDFVRRQLDYALSEEYDPDAEAFDFSQYMANTYEQMALRRSPERDGDLSEALALLMAWDSVVRGVLHWDSLNPRPSLGVMQSLPVAASRVGRLRIFLRRWSGARLPWLYMFRGLRRMLQQAIAERRPK